MINEWDDVDELEEITFEDNTLFTVTNRVLLIDGDILVYKPCCVFNEDTEQDREQAIRLIKKRISDLMAKSEAESYIIYLTPKTNFRNYIASDYKLQRKVVVRPVNLKYMKSWCRDHLGAIAKGYLEADDLLTINHTSDNVIFSEDKDLRQSEGLHLNEESGIITVDDEGEVYRKEDGKYYFNGYKGFLFQCLTGDTADYIIGCGIRTEKTYKSGNKAGQKYLSRSGCTPLKALAILSAPNKSLKVLEVMVGLEYKKVFGKDWLENFEKQARLLWMIREVDQEYTQLKMWSYLNLKNVWMDLTNDGALYEN